MSSPKIAVAGFGQRGKTFVELAMNEPGIELAGVCDCSEARLTGFARRHNCTAPLFTSLEKMLDEVRPEGVVVAVPDFQHAPVAVAAMKRGCAVLLEKPMAPTVEGCREILRHAGSCRGALLGFVLRGHPVYRKVKELLDEKTIGQVMNFQADEELFVLHGASYMRRWHRHVASSGGFMLAKCSHDIDILSWLAGENPCRVSSFGSLSFFTSDKLKCEFCSQCPDKDCRFRFAGEMVYMTEEEKSDPSAFGFDRCVYTRDKDVIDHQVVNFEYPSGVTASFSLDLFAPVPKRRLKVIGTTGYIEADSHDFTVDVSFSDGREARHFKLEQDNDSGHGGSDLTLFRNFIALVRGEKVQRAGLEAGLASTVVGTAIETARREHRVVEIPAQAYATEVQI
ncbi:MAG: Gfo/Idh/MocA family oxidoreductase [Lentisphaeria bacterium]|nr:Gfo/Idh/MocA family oxidoreductase [Lentisphaeria bacterium]